MFKIEFDPASDDHPSYETIVATGEYRKDTIVDLLQKLPENYALDSGFLPALEVAFCNLGTKIKFWNGVIDTYFLVTRV